MDTTMTTPTRTTITFETALGRCGVRWSDAGITGVLLLSSRLDSLPPTEPGDDVPAFVGDAIEAMTAVLASESRDLRAVPLDHQRIDPFRRAVYAATREIKPGTT